MCVCVWMYLYVCPHAHGGQRTSLGVSIWKVTFFEMVSTLIRLDFVTNELKGSSFLHSMQKAWIQDLILGWQVFLSAKPSPQPHNSRRTSPTCFLLWKIPWQCSESLEGLGEAHLHSRHDLLCGLFHSFRIVIITLKCIFFFKKKSWLQKNRASWIRDGP